MKYLITVLKDLDSYYRDFIENGFYHIRLEF